MIILLTNADEIFCAANQVSFPNRYMTMLTKLAFNLQQSVSVCFKILKHEQSKSTALTDEHFTIVDLSFLY